MGHAPSAEQFSALLTQLASATWASSMRLSARLIGSMKSRP
jgi:hypothetical protein